ncbi:MAG: hypothetical protein U5S82_20905 [Gammaproteobacteria bacterium]|nr:hypothetical protein [Gammaproteobacteria bacterium]
MGCALTKDKNIRYRTAELDAVRRHSAMVIVIRAKDATADDMAALLIEHSAQIARFVQRTQPPFVCGLDRSGRLKHYDL